MERKIPVTILTGFLGSGKTTFLNYVLKKQHGKKIAIIQNEFGAEIGLEGAVVVGQDGTSDNVWLELPNGCICCTVKSDLLLTVEQLTKNSPSLDHIFIETTGMADPAPVVEVFWVDEELDSPVFLDAVIVFVDLKHILLHLGQTDAKEPTEAHKQVSLADVLIFNKVDLVEASEQAAIVQRLSGINPFAKHLYSTFSAVPIESVLNLACYSNRPMPSETSLDHAHDGGIETAAFRVVGSLRSPEVLTAWLGSILWEEHHSMEIFRMKGVFHVEGEAFKYSLQAVHQLFTVDVTEVPWAKEEVRTNMIVCIGRNLDTALLQTGFQNLYKA